MRWGPGPVFTYECLTNSRRWQTYAQRAGGVSALLLAMALIALSETSTQASSWSDYAELGQGYFVTLIGVELAIVLLAAPAATAGAICLDRARGTLAHMLMTDLSDPEIVLGKLAARLLPVLGLVACTWPVMAICSLLGGIDPIALTLAFAIIVAIAVLGCSIALAISVWARKSHEVILATYTVFILGILFWPIWYMLAMARWTGPVPPRALLANPFYVAFAPYADPGALEGWDYFVFFAATLGTSILVTLIAVWRMRPVACRGAAEKNRGSRIGWMGRAARWLPGPSLDGNPVLWREWHRSRPSRWMTAIIALLMGTTGALCIAGAVAYWHDGVDIRPGVVWQIVGICSYVLHVIFGLLMLAAIAPTSMAEERQRGSLDLLAATTLSTRAIVIGKWLGTFRLVAPLTIGPGLIALAMATAHSNSSLAFGPGLPPEYYRRISLGTRCYGAAVAIATILAHGALITSVGLALAVWIKRQSRAIALTVGWFILVTAAWPIVVSIVMSGDSNRGENLVALSPVAVCINLIPLLTQRTYAFMNGTLRSGTFWAVEVSGAALAILRLTIRTFDGCFDRIPDRPWQISHRTAGIKILAAIVAAGCLVGAVDCWIEGVEVGFNGPSYESILAFCLVLAIALVLVGAETARTGTMKQTEIRDANPTLAIREFVFGQWWTSFQLVLLLAIGPTLLALALATAHRTPHYSPQFTKNAAGVDVVTSFVLERTDQPYAGEVRLGQRLAAAAVLIATIMVHGGAAISVGMAFAVVSGWSRRTIAAGVVLAVLVALVLPVCILLLNNRRPPIDGGWSFALATSSLLIALLTRTSFILGETIVSVTAWDIATALFAIALCSWTVWSWQRRLRNAPGAEPAHAIGHNESRPAVESRLVVE